MTDKDARANQVQWGRDERAIRFKLVRCRRV